MQNKYRIDFIGKLSESFNPPHPIRFTHKAESIEEAKAMVLNRYTNVSELEIDELPNSSLGFSFRTI